MKPAGAVKIAKHFVLENGYTAQEAIDALIVLRAPEGMHNCEDAVFLRTSHGTASLWEMGWRERIRILLTGRIWLHVCAGGQTQPPVALFVHWNKPNLN